MTKKEIFDLEATNTCIVTLYHEGSFWIAYERSAYILCSQVKQFKPSKKVIKSAGGVPIISIGFPVGKEAGNLAGLTPITKADDRLVYKARYQIKVEDFDIWKESVPVKEANSKTLDNVKNPYLYTNLPVYEESYKFLQALYTLLDKVPKDIKYTLLEQVKKDVLDLTLNIYNANVTFDKAPVLAMSRELLERIKIQVRLLCDLRCMSIKLYCQLSETEESISKQLASWHKYVKESKNEVLSRNQE